MTRAMATLQWAALSVLAAILLVTPPDSGIVSSVAAAAPPCHAGFLSCYNGECLRQSKFCDGQQDCKDNSDEIDCESPCRPPDFFRCHNGKCISHLFVCDGEDECADGSDENDCLNTPVVKVSCREDEFHCGDGLCVPAHFRCDGEYDCHDGSDEILGCTEQLECDGFLCANHMCIPREWHCDGQDDCRDNSDELGCPSKTGPVLCPLERGLFPCKNRKDCAELSELCNEVKDCPDGSDEGPGCNVQCVKFGCGHKCIQTPDGPICTCPSGYAIFNEKYCKDIDECQLFGICSQKCKNTAGSYRCECVEDFELQSDNKTCKDTGHDALLVYAMKTEIRALELKSKRLYSVVQDQKHITGVAYDGTYVYWTSIVNGEEAIVKCEKDGSHKEIIITSGLSFPEDLAVDWVTGNIYFTDSQMRHIGVCENSGKTCTIIVNEDIDTPRAIALLVTEGLMFWTDWGHKPMVARAGMDGSSPVAFVSENIKWPGGLALDINNERVYWVDTKLDVIESIKFDGSDRRTILGEVVKNALVLDIFEENLYWSDKKTSEIKSCNKFTGKNIQKVEYSRDNYVYGIQIFHPSIYSKNITNSCKNVECSDMCLLAPNSTYSCACPENKILKDDKHTCIAIEKHEVLAIGGGSELVLLTHKSFGKQEMISIPFQHVEKIGALAYHNVDDSIFISDIARKQISIVDLETRTLKPLVSHEIGTVNSLSYDHLGDNLYWCDSEHGTIEVMSLSTMKRATLYRSYGEDTPMAVVVLSEKGIMFIVFKKSHGLHQYHIDKMNMDGTGGIIHLIETNIQGPQVTLTHDLQLDELIFADSGRGSIESCEIDGTHHEPLQSLSHSPISVATLGNDLFWTSRESSHLYWSSKMKKFAQVKRIPLGMFGSDVSLVLTSIKGTVTNSNYPCRSQNGGCSDLCLVSSNGSVCACPHDYELQSDNKTCTIPTHCARHQFKCERENKCIPLLFRCNGHQDCFTNEDELNCPKPCHVDEFECDNGQCIASIQRCDDKTQCSDGSDEFNCNPVSCERGEFQCFSGECIREEWKCDLHEDCKDGSDEENEICLDAACPEGKFRCKSGTCIPASWECDHEINCADASDEHEGCPQVVCAPEDFLCSNKRCIDKSLQCNKLDECGDNSDEENCPQDVDPKFRSYGCTENQFRCTEEENLCLPISVRCNGSAECPKGEDEFGCGCSQTEFECDHNKCIDENWVCDGRADCVDKSDEEPRLCKGRQTPGPCFGYRCASGQCIELSLACNGDSDCSDGSDEGPKCDSCNNGNPCEGICNPTPSGPQCSCPTGFSMRESSSCVDDDECIQNVCSQRCENTPGSFKCSCVDGYTLNINRMSCKADGDALTVIFVANGNEIRLAPLSFQTLSVFHQDFGIKIRSLDVNIPKKLVYWSTDKKGAIFFKSLEDKTIKKVTGLGRPTTIAVDWITDNIYFSEDSEDSAWVKVCNFEVKRCAKVVAAETGHEIDNLVVDPIAGYIFWTEGNEDFDSSYTIKRADMTGANSSTLVSGVSYVTGLATDFIHRQLFWADTSEAIVGAVGYHGEGRHLVLDREVKHASGLALHEDSLFWVSRGLGKLVKCAIYGQSKTCDWVALYARNVDYFALFQEQRQRKGENKCPQMSCAHMCVSGATKPRCICSDGTLAEGKEQCENVSPATTLSFSDKTIETHQTSFPGVGIFMIILFFLIALVALAYVFKTKLKISTPDFSRSVRFITSPYATLKKATTGSTKLDSKMDAEEEMEDVLHKNEKSPAVPSAPATTPVSTNGRRTLHFKVSDIQSSDEETDFTGKDTARLIP